VPEEPAGRHEPAAAGGAVKGALVLLAAMASIAGCAATQRAAAHDPMKCEQNPDCAARRGAYMDCSRQCADDPACVDRCIEATTDQPKH
jgi:hypothetical protein